MERQRLQIHGRVQGVGFRPFVWRLAHASQLSGFVCNSGDGVTLEVQGPSAALSAFHQQLQQTLPPLASISHLETHSLPVRTDESDFDITASEPAGGCARLPADSAPCPACLNELFEPDNRRYGHAFITCTDCGPRDSISHRLPYDRAHTSMARFALCPACQSDYTAPANRRFHAETLACPACGPQLQLRDSSAATLAGEPIAETVRLIQRGAIVAVKGLGGFHLLCDARQPDAVARLRARKQRPTKPLALLVPNVASARQWAQVNDAEARWLAGRENPIVLLDKQPHSDAMLAGIAPDMGQLGLLLPPAPLHWLLLHAALGHPAGHGWRHEAQPIVWVMTSANRSGAPTVINNHAALTELTDIADAFLLHDRDIVTRSDDSVLTVVDGAPLFHRRARGFAPELLPMAHGGPPVLALGAYLKNTATLMCDHEARLSTHVGDLDHPQTCVALDQAVERLLAGANTRPAVIACDRQTDSYASQLAERLAEHWHVPLLAVQHHHAHLAAVMAEHALEAPALGLALDGFGLGDDGAAWGGELMQLEGSGYRHLGSLATLPLPGGDRAAREPWCMAVGLWHQLGQPGPLPPHLTAHPDYTLLQQQLNRRFNCPDSSSLGRWFDAIAGLTGRCPQQHFEGEAAQQLEALAQSCPPLAHGWAISANLSGRSQLDLSPLARHLLTLNDATAIASLWHSTLIAALADWLIRTARTTGLTLIVLGGGCLANRRLHRGLRQALTQAGLRVYLPQALPPGDGGISLGQAWIARQWWRATQRS